MNENEELVNRKVAGQNSVKSAEDNIRMITRRTNRFSMNEKVAVKKKMKKWITVSNKTWKKKWSKNILQHNSIWRIETEHARKQD